VPGRHTQPLTCRPADGESGQHIQILIEHLTEHGYRVSIEMDDDAFEKLERVEP